MSKSQAQALIALLALILALGAPAQDLRIGPGIEVRYPAGMAGAADRVLAAYPSAKETMESALGLRYTETLSVWIERDHEDFNRRITALGGAPRPEHIAAVAFPLHDVVILKADAWRRGEANAFEVTFQHELVHCLLGELRRRQPELNLPTWLDEGIAQWVSAAPFFGDPDQVAQAIRKEILIPFEKLRTDFPDQEGASALAYAQSYSLVRFIAERGNPTGRKNNIQALLLLLAKGSDVEQAIHSVIGLDFEQLERAWKDETRAHLPFSLHDIPEFLFASLLFVLAVLAFSVHRVRRAERLAQFDAEDPEPEDELEEEPSPELSANQIRRSPSRLDRIHRQWRVAEDEPRDDEKD